LKDFDTYQGMFEELSNKIVSTENKQILSDNSMAIIFKLLRIQYALSHQDERDK